VASERAAHDGFKCHHAASLGAPSSSSGYTMPLQYSGSYATADRDQVDAGCIRMENGEWRMENGEWRIENGEGRMENGEGRMDVPSGYTLTLI